MSADMRERVKDVKKVKLETPEVVSRLGPMAEAAAHSAMSAARLVRDRARKQVPSSDQLLRGVGLERRRSRLARLLSWPLVLGAAAGAALAYFFDPDQGRRRRATARDRAYGALRDAGRLAERGSRLAGSQAYGLSQRITHLRPSAETPNDATLVDRVMSEAFRGLDPDLKGRVNLNAVGGVVYLRGELERPEDIRALEDRVRRTPGVNEVENLLHLPGTPAPSSP